MPSCKLATGLIVLASASTTLLLRGPLLSSDCLAFSSPVSSPDAEAAPKALPSKAVSSPSRAVSFPTEKEPATIFIITPSNAKRPAQKSDLTRFSQTLQLVPHLHWVLIEDSKEKSPMLSALLQRSGLNYTHLAIKNGTGWGNGQRDVGISWVREHLSGLPGPVNAVVFFADDDNTYDIRLFNDFVRKVKKVGTWPVGFSAKMWVESAKVEKGKVVGWDTKWHAERDFAIDMAGFAFHASLLLANPDVAFGKCVRRGWDEDCILKQLGAKMEELEVFGHEEGAEVLVWHTNTKQNGMANELKGSKKGWVI